MRRLAAVIVIVVVAAVLLSHLNSSSPNGSPANGWYEARPVYGMIGSGFFVRVASRRPVRFADGSGGVLMQVAFRNQGRTRFGTRPGDFQVLQPSGGILQPDFLAPACPRWQAVEVASGTLSRPVPLCFAQTDPAQAITLLWQPDVAPGPLGTASRIELPAQPVPA
jgi:hypothetical protein